MFMTHGTLLPEAQLKSRYLGANRTIRIYLPPSYETSPKQRYPVLYVHDGQNVFSSAGADACYGWGSWELDLTADALAAEKKMQQIIMVAVDNSRSRYREYRGPVSASAGASTRDAFENYTSFLIKELKPMIDGDY